jgi:hypothetical protein
MEWLGYVAFFLGIAVFVVGCIMPNDDPAKNIVIGVGLAMWAFGCYAP